MEDAVALVLERRRRRHPGRLPVAGIIAAVLLHLAITATAAVLTRFDAEKAAPLEFVAVRIVPAQALGRPEPPPQAKPPAPEPEPEVAAPEPEPEPEVAIVPEPKKPEPEAKKPEPKKPQPTPPAAKPSAAAPKPATETPATAHQGSPTGSPTATSAVGAQVAALGDPDFTYGYYLDRVLAAIEANWRPPPTDGARIEVAVDFRIRRDGTVTELDIATSSGLSSFDLAGLRAVQAASPLPPLPAGYRKDSLAIRLLIR